MKRSTLIRSSFVAAALVASAASAREARAAYPSSQCATATSGIITCNFEPSTTGAGITHENLAIDYNHVVVPAKPHSPPVMVLFLGGSTSSPAGYQTISQEAASLGYYVIDLRYDNAKLVNNVCSTDDCFTQYRGQTIWGTNIAVPGQPLYAWSSEPAVSAADSIVNRAANLIDTLSAYDAAWKVFIGPGANKSYTSKSYPNGVMPAWGNIVLSGHSGGAGDAAFMTLTIPAVRRAALFSGPDDWYTGTDGKIYSASWVTAAAGKPYASKIWGVRNWREGIYGECTSMNWENEGLGSGIPGVSSCAIPAWEYNVGDGSGASGATGQHYLLFTSYPYGAALYCHDSTAADDNVLDGSTIFPFTTNRSIAWDYLLTANKKD
jgi:hypothetical protein